MVSKIYEAALMESLQILDILSGKGSRPRQIVHAIQESRGAVRFGEKVRLQVRSCQGGAANQDPVHGPVRARAQGHEGLEFTWCITNKDQKTAESRDGPKRDAK